MIRALSSREAGLHKPLASHPQTHRALLEDTFPLFSSLCSQAFLIECSEIVSYQDAHSPLVLHVLAEAMLYSVHGFPSCIFRFGISVSRRLAHRGTGAACLQCRWPVYTVVWEPADQVQETKATCVQGTVFSVP